MRKKIPTITRPDPAYAASLRPEVEEDPGREEVQRAEATPEPASAQPVVVDDHIAPPPSTPPPPTLSPDRRRPDALRHRPWHRQLEHDAFRRRARSTSG